MADLKVVIASGKGGTGKTTLAVSLALALHQQGLPVKLLDCDVEAPNAHISLRPEITGQKEAVIQIPKIDPQRCTQCKTCVEVCRYHALFMAGSSPVLLPQLCHGCGSCTLQCPSHAISEMPHTIGQLQEGDVSAGLSFASGELTISEPLATPVIRQLKQWQSGTDVVLLMDAPPGASCPVVETLQGADFALLVTEPTPFGLHDLKQIVQVVRRMKIPFMVVVNRSTLASGLIEQYCAAQNITIGLKIPFQKEIAARWAAGQPLLAILPGMQDSLWQLFNLVEECLIAKREDGYGGC